MRKNKPYSIVLSLLVAFGLWLYVINNISQEDDTTFYNIPVVMKGETVLSERNLMITAVSDRTVDLHLSGARSELNKVYSGNITVEVELSGIEEPGQRIPLPYSRISYPGDVPNNAFVVQSKNPGNIYVDVDYRRTKEIPVEIKYLGVRREGYIYDTENAVMDNPYITVTGPATVVDQIKTAVIEVNLTERLETISESFRYTLCDQAGEPVDAEQVTTNVEEIRLDMAIQKIKIIALKVDLIYGGGATQENTKITYGPVDAIRVSGGDAVLAELGDTYTLGTINLAELDKAVNELSYTITLPEGVTNQTGVSDITVWVRFSGLKTKEFTITNISAVNVPEGLEAEIVTTNLKVNLRGPMAQIDALTESDITAVVDFSNAEVGDATYRVNLSFGSAFPNVGPLKTVSVPATVRAAGG